MGSFAAPKKDVPELIEPTPAPEFLITGCLPPVIHCGIVSVVCFAELPNEDGSGMDFVKRVTMRWPETKYRQMMIDHYAMQKQVAKESVAVKCDPPGEATAH